MLIKILGSGTGIPYLKRQAASIFIKAGRNIMLDSGPGSLRTLLKAGVSYLDIDAIFYTHLHYDHVADLTTLLFASKIPPSLRKKPLKIYGPRGLRLYILRLRSLYKETISADTYKLDIKEIGPRRIRIGGLVFNPQALRHHGGSMGYRITTANRKSVVYTGDTDYCEELIRLAHKADILISECSSPDHMKIKGHLTPTEAGLVAREAHVKVLILVHMYPPCDKFDIRGTVKRHFSGKILIGKDLMTIKI